MIINVNVTQNFASSEHVMDILTTNEEAILRLILSGLAKPGSGPTGGTIKVQNSEFPGVEIQIDGHDLSFDASGHLISGIINEITVLAPDGTEIGAMNSSDIGAFAVDVAPLRMILTDAQALAGLFGEHRFTYSAAGLTKSSRSVSDYGASFEGGLQADVIIGSQFADRLGGSWGDDRICGGAGNDVIDGDGTLYLDGADQPGCDILFGGRGADILIGRGGDDKIFGGDQNDVLVGDNPDERGDDSLYGGNGDDVIWAEQGDDLLNGGAGYDRIAPLFDRLGEFILRIDLSAGTMTGTGTDKLLSIEGAAGAVFQKNVLIGNGLGNGLSGGSLDDSISGKYGDDRLSGSAGADDISGGSGADILSGGSGIDTLHGNADADCFVFIEDGSINADLILDFGGDDRIALFQELLDWENAGPLRATAYRNMQSGAVDSDDRVIYDPETGKVWVDADGSGAGTRRLLCTVEIGTVLTAEAFTVLDYTQLPDYA